MNGSTERLKALTGEQPRFILTVYMSMSDDSRINIGDTLSGGIQEVSALLPLLGTEQCERHVGSALDKGYLYAAATPLSIFGGLGIVKTAFSTLLATTTYPFRGANWLDDAGFASPGTVSSLVTIEKGTKDYGAEVRLCRLLEDQHIEDPRLVSTVKWSGWAEVDDCDSGVNQVPKYVVPWNWKLIFVSALGSIISMAPYIYLVLINKFNDRAAWLFPVFRSFGSFLCVVFIQLALQLRIYHIVESRLLLMKYQKRNPTRNLPQGGLEHKLRACFPNPTPWEHWVPSSPGIKMEQQAASLLAFDYGLLCCQAIMVVGMGMIVVGYIGCFNLVSRKDGVKNGPYVWVGSEVFLALIRITLWGLNPDWDDSTGVKLSLQLYPNDTTLPDPYFPLITTASSINNNIFEGITFVGHPQNEFLGAATSFTGPLPRFKSEDISSLLYAVVPTGRNTKALCTVVILTRSHYSICLVFDDNLTASPKVIMSTYQTLPETTILLVTLGKLMRRAEISLSRDIFNTVCEHSRNLAIRLFKKNRHSGLNLKWDLTLNLGPPSESLLGKNMVEAMTEPDKEYLKIRDDWSQKHDHMRQRAKSVQRDVNKYNGTRDHIMHMLHVLLFESLVLERYLCYKDLDFAARRGSSDKSLPRRLVYEWIAGVRERMDADWRRIEQLCPPDECSNLGALWDNALSDLLQVRQCAHKPLREIPTYIMKQASRTSLTSSNLSTILRQMPVIQVEPLGTLSASIQVQASANNSREFSLESELALLRLHLLLTRGFEFQSQLKGASASYFFQPYLAFEQVSEYYLHGLARSDVACVLQLCSEDSDARSMEEFLVQLAVLDKTRLTTLNAARIPKMANLSSLLLDILEKHNNIVAMTCPPFVDQTIIRERISVNRRAWWQRARQPEKGFRYLVGFEPYNEGNEVGASGEPISVEGDRICLLYKSDTQCLVLVHTPSNGTVSLNFCASTTGGDLEPQVTVGLRTSDPTTGLKVIPAEIDTSGVKFRVSIDLEMGDYEVWVALVAFEVNYESGRLVTVTDDVILKGPIQAEFHEYEQAEAT